jgi:hypothetical protein
MMSVLLTLLLVLACGVSMAEEPSADPSDLDELSWMVGSGLMLGLHRDVFPSGRTFFEFLRIEAGDDGVTYWASPRGREATPFRLIESKPGRVVFENSENDWPQRILYWLEDKDTLAARAEGEQGGKSRAAEWHWTRASQTHD